MLDREDPRLRTPPLLARAVHRCTGGRPLAAALLTKTAGQAVRAPVAPAVPAAQDAAPLTPRVLLDLPVALREDLPGRQVAAELLAQLVDPARLEPLTVLAAAHDTADAQVLHPPAISAMPGARRACCRREICSPTSPGRLTRIISSVTRCSVRCYCTGCMRTRRTGALCRAPARPLSGRGPTRLHHELALGGTGNAVAYLRDSFGGCDTAVWLEGLRFIASAPFFGQPDERRGVALGRTDSAQSVPPGTDLVFHLRIRRLLFCLWHSTDILALPDDEVTEKTGHELAQLSALHPTGNEVLWVASRTWPSTIREWRLPGRSAD